MSQVVLLAGSPSATSKSTQLLDVAALLLSSYGLKVVRFGLDDFPAEDLLYARWHSPAVKAFNQAIADSAGLIVATPVYKAAYSGAVKTVLDLLPERALEQKVALALATGGSLGHLLAVDYALQPVLSALKARHIIGGVYATDADFSKLDSGKHALNPEIEQRLQAAVARFIAHLPNPGHAQLHGHELSQQVRAAQISI
jgi:FMN reductase